MITFRCFIEKLLTKKVWKNNILFRLYITSETILNYFKLHSPTAFHLPHCLVARDFSREVHCFSRKFVFNAKNLSVQSRGKVGWKSNRVEVVRLQTGREVGWETLRVKVAHPQAEERWRESRFGWKLCAPKQEGRWGESREFPNWRGRRVGRGTGIKIFYFV